LHAAHQDGQDEGPVMTAKPMVRFYAVIFNKIGALLNEIYVDIRSKSGAHKLIKDWIQKYRPGVGFLRHIFLHYPLFSAAPGLFCFPNEKNQKNNKKILLAYFDNFNADNFYTPCYEVILRMERLKLWNNLK